MALNPSKNKQILSELLLDAGFKHIGFAKAEFMDPEARRLEQWLHKGNHGHMTYLERHFDKRVDPRKLVPGAKSVVVMTYNYFPSRGPLDPEAPKIARYAYGRDYHKVIRKKLKHILEDFRQAVGEVSGRCFVDSAPVLERDWARRAGIGWTGKNTLLLNKNQGSYFFLAEMILDVAFAYDTPVQDYCGTCTRCIDACPTEAISKDGYVLDASRCISYLTIELKEAIPEEFSGQMENWIFGCDICQEVCPWNRFSKEHNEPAFEPSTELLEMTRADWEALTTETFEQLFSGSAVKRAGFDGLKRNIKFLGDNKSD